MDLSSLSNRICPGDLTSLYCDPPVQKTRNSPNLGSNILIYLNEENDVASVFSLCFPLFAILFQRCLGPKPPLHAQTLAPRKGVASTQESRQSCQCPCPRFRVTGHAECLCLIAVHVQPHRACPCFGSGVQKLWSLARPEKSSTRTNKVTPMNQEFSFEFLVR